jgi:hypothetical protein
MVPVEVRVLCGDYSVLEISRDLAERNEFVAFAMRRVVNRGLQAALDVHRGCRWVDPTGGQKGQRGKRPKKHHADDKPSNKGWEEARPKRGLGLWVRYCSLLQSHFRIIAWAGSPLMDDLVLANTPSQCSNRVALSETPPVSGPVDSRTIESAPCQRRPHRNTITICHR